MDVTLKSGTDLGQMRNRDIGRKSLGRPTLYALVFLGLYLSYRVLSPFITAATWAVTFAILFRGLQVKFASRMGPNRAAGLTTSIVGLLIVVPAIFLVVAFAREAPHVSDYVKQSSHGVPGQFERMWNAARAKSPVPLPPDPAEPMRKVRDRAIAFMSSRASSLVSDSLASLGTLGAMLFTLFFVLRDGDTMRRRLRDRLPFPEDESDRLMGQIRDLVTASVGAGVIVAAAQGAIAGLAFWLLRMGAPVFWGVVTAFCSLLPVVGATIVWVPAGIGLLLSGETMRGVLMLLIGAFGISMVDNILRPILLTGKTSISGLVIFFGLLGGAAAFGLVGLVIGPIILVITPQILDGLRPRPVDEPGVPDDRLLASKAG